jgi:signal peptidase II
MLFVLFMIFFIVAADQAVKYWAVHFLAESTFRPEIPGLIGLTYVENRGAAFGMLQNMRLLFLIVTPIVVAVILFALYKKKVYGKLGVWSLVMITGGALGNFIDRAITGYVVDIFELKFMNFAIFNVADSFVSVGAVLFCIYILFIHDKEAAKRKAGGQYDSNAAL